MSQRHRLRSLPTATLLILLATSPAALAREREVALSGRIELVTGRGIAGVVVELHPNQDLYQQGLAELWDEGPPVVAVARTDEEGAFHFLAPEPGFWSLTARAAGYVRMQYTLAPLIDDAEIPTLQLTPDAGAEVTVVDVADRPVSGARLEALSSPRPPSLTSRGWSEAKRKGFTDGRGSAPLSRGSGETLVVVVTSPGLGETVVMGERRIQARLASDDSRPLSLRVVETSGKPAASVLARTGQFLMPVALSNDDGILSVPAAGRSPVRLHLSTADGRDQRVILETGQADQPESPLVILEPAHHVSSRVVNRQSGRAVSGALVWYRQELPPWALDEHRFPRAGFAWIYTMTDAAGRYLLGAVTKNEIQIYGVAPGYQLGRSSLSYDPQHPGSGPQLELTPAATVRGVVVDVEKRPVEGVQVVAVRAPGLAASASSALDAVHTRTDRRGRFQLRQLISDGTYHVRVWKHGFAPTAVVLRLPASSIREPIRVVLSPGTIATGKVVDIGRRPVPGASVRLVPVGNETPWSDFSPRPDTLESITEGDGSFSILSLASPLRADLKVWAAGFAPMIVRGLEIPAGEEVFDLGTATLEPGVSLRGRVIDSKSRPVQGAHVQLIREARFATDPDARPQALSGPDGRVTAPDTATATEPDGSFVIPDLVTHEVVDLEVMLPGYAPASATGISVPTLEPVEIVLKAGCGVWGQVVDQKGTGIGHAEVLFYADPARPLAGKFPRFETDEGGFFVGEDLGESGYRVEVRARGYLAHSQIVELRADGQELKIALVTGAVVQGRVLQAWDDRGAAGARVSFEQLSAETDGRGRYRLEGVPEGRHSIFARGSEGRVVVEELDVGPGSNRLDLVLERGVEVSGRVVDGEGRPLADATASLRAVAGDGRFGHHTTAAAPDGSFLLRGVARGIYRLGARKQGYAPAQLPYDLEVTHGPVAELELQLGEGGTIAGSIHGLSFNELAKVHVQASGSERRVGEVDYEGNYRFSGLGAGVWRVVAQADDRLTEGDVVLEQPGEEATLDLRFDEGVTLSGVVLQNGEPLTAAHLSLSSPELSISRSGRTNYEGGFRFADLSEGRYLLQVGSRGYVEEIELTNDREVTVEVELASLRGLVTDAATDLAIPGAAFTLEPEVATASRDGLPFRTESQGDGGFALRAVPVGHYRLLAVKEGYAAKEWSVAVDSSRNEILRLHLERAEGLSLRLRDERGFAPSSVRVAVLGSDGHSLVDQTFRPDWHGWVELSTVPNGRWELLVTAPGAAAQTLWVEVPGPSFDLTLAPESRLRILLPALQQTNQFSSLTLRDSAGQLFRLPGRTDIRGQWRIERGQIEISFLPHGSWKLNGVVSDGRTWSTTATTIPESVSEVVVHEISSD